MHSHTGTVFQVRGQPWCRVAAALAAALLVALGITGTVLAATTMGNEATDRDHLDTWSNVTVVDTNNPAGVDGVITQVTIYGATSGTVRFVIVDSDLEITQISSEVTVAGNGTETLTLDAPLVVTVGDNLGVHFVAHASVPFDGDVGALAYWNDQGVVPVIGLEVGTGANSPQARTYSMNAQIEPASPDACKNGGWTIWGFRNQGLCIASLVANENSVH